MPENDAELAEQRMELATVIQKRTTVSGVSPEHFTVPPVKRSNVRQRGVMAVACTNAASKEKKWPEFKTVTY